MNHTDFDEFGFTEGCKGCEFSQTGIGQRQNHSRGRVEAELAKSEEGQTRIDRSKDRIDHWVAKAREEPIIEHDSTDDQCIGHGEMKTEAIENNHNDDGNVEMRQPEQLDISDASQGARGGD